VSLSAPTKVRAPPSLETKTSYWSTGAPSTGGDQWKVTGTAWATAGSANARQIPVRIFRKNFKRMGFIDSTTPDLDGAEGTGPKAASTEWTATRVPRRTQG